MNKTKSIILNIIIIEITYLLFKIFETCFKIWELLQLEHFILWFNDGLIFLKQFIHIKYLSFLQQISQLNDLAILLSLIL